MFKHLWICWFDAMIVFSLIPFFGYETHHQMLKTCTSSIRCSRSNTHLLFLLLKSFTNDKINLHFIISCLIVDPFLISNRTESFHKPGKTSARHPKKRTFPTSWTDVAFQPWMEVIRDADVQQGLRVSHQGHRVML